MMNDHGYWTPEIRLELTDTIAANLGIDAAELSYAQVGRINNPGDSIKFIVRDSRDRPVAFLVLSPPSSKDLASRYVASLSAADGKLSAKLDAVLPTVICHGEVESRSYIVLQYLAPISGKRYLRAIQKLALRPKVLSWLRGVARDTQGPGILDSKHRAPLEYLCALDVFPIDLKETARKALSRLETGTFSPVQILAHGDLWDGNIMLSRRCAGLSLRKHGFYLIDWPGSSTEGYPFYDLIRFFLAFSFTNRRMRVEFERHCRIVGCEAIDVRTYLLSALGFIAMKLDHFPMERFLDLARRSNALLDRIGL